MQTKRGSLIEALINVVIGYSINFTANMLVFPMFGWHITVKQNLVLGVIFTVISIARSYFIRRYFNHLIVRAAERLAHERPESQQGSTGPSR